MYRDGYEQTDGEQDTQGGGGGGGVNTAGQRTDLGSGADWSPGQRMRCIETGTNRQTEDRPRVRC